MIARISALVSLELRSAWRRPLWWVLTIVLLLLTWGLIAGNVQIGAGGRSAHAERLWVNNEFNLAFMDVLVFTLLYLFFVAVAFGSAITDDEEHRIGSILHGTRLTTLEYVLGRWLGVALIACIVMGIHLAVQMWLYQTYPIDEPDKMRGPFDAWNYVRPFLLFVTMPVLCLGAFTFAVGAITRQAILVFLVPILILLACVFFFWSWSPEWLDPSANALLQTLEPTGFRWLNETYIKDDRGAAFYNNGTLALDGTFLLNRGWEIGLAIASLAVTVAVERRRLRHPHRLAPAKAAEIVAKQDAIDASAVPVARTRTDPSLSTLEMRQRKPAWLATFIAQARAEARELARSPGLWLFVPLITLQVVGNTFYELGPFDTSILLTPGGVAERSFNTVTLLSLFLLLFYTTESMARDDRRRMTSIVASGPAQSSARLLGNMFANVAVVLLVELAAIYLALVITMVIQFLQGATMGEFLAPSPWPLVRVWTLFLLPTVFVWMGMIALVWSIARNRYAVYGVGLGLLMITGLLYTFGWINWVGNWHMWDAVQWTDFGSFQLDRSALLLNRVAWMLVGVLLVQLALMANRRRMPDATGIASRFRPKAVIVGALKTLPVAVPAALLLIALALQVRAGEGGGPSVRAAKAYRAANAETWRNHKEPFIKSMDLDVKLDPAAGSFEVSGTYELTNPYDAPMERFSLTPGLHFEDLKFTFQDATHDETSVEEARRAANRGVLPMENSAGLWVFRPSKPLAKGDTAKVAFTYHGNYPSGVGFNTRGAGEFILPSGVVLNAFGNSFLPLVGWVDGVGVDPEDATEPRRPEPDEWKKQTKPGLGTGGASEVVVRVTIPEEYRANSPGVLESDVVKDGWRTMTWRADQPVRFFNIVAGKLVETKGEHTSIWHLAEHSRNVPSMLRALDGARTWYSQWFYPYPWKELRLTEFPGLATYAQGFGTNIVFSEAIGFLAMPTSEQDGPFLITAHEAAHQWWGNILMPGDGPGGNILSEGLAHYSTARLMEQLGCGMAGSDKPMSGEQARQSFLRGIEKQYTERRSADEERPLVEIDGTRPGDETVTYDKGGWVFWMLHDVMGKQAADAGTHDFIKRFKDGPDYPLLQDFVQVMREHAPDKAKFDAFVDQWFFDVVLPEFKVREATATKQADGTWLTKVTIENAGAGTGKVNVQVAVTNGIVRWPTEEGEVYEDARKEVTLEYKPRGTPDDQAGPSATVEIATPFEPLKILIDPDVRLLQMKRKSAEGDVTTQSRST